MIFGRIGTHGVHVEYISVRANCQMEWIKSAAYTVQDRRYLFIESVCIVITAFLLVEAFLIVTEEHRYV